MDRGSRPGIRMVGRIVVFSLLAACIFEFAASYLYVASVQYMSAGLAGLSIHISFGSRFGVFYLKKSGLNCHALPESL